MVGAIRIFPNLAAVLALAACSSATPATAPPPPDHEAEDAAWIARDFTCSNAEAKPVTLDALAADPDRYEETCVSVNAFFTGLGLVRNAYQIQAHQPGPSFPAYNKDKKTEMHYRLNWTFAVVTGRVRSCAARTDRQTAATTPLCRDKGFGLFVSDVQVVPTAMD
jgi:hypothetical protein